jgi:hypothetical protein
MELAIELSASWFIHPFISKARSQNALTVLDDRSIHIWATGGAFVDVYRFRGMKILLEDLQM